MTYWTEYKPRVDRGDAKSVKIRLVLSVDVNVSDWRAEYGTDDAVRDIRAAVESSLVEAARMAYPVATFGAMVRVRQAER